LLEKLTEVGFTSSKEKSGSAPAPASVVERIDELGVDVADCPQARNNRPVKMESLGKSITPITLVNLSPKV
jgi:hypothetical protein